MYNSVATSLYLAIALALALLDEHSQHVPRSTSDPQRNVYAIPFQQHLFFFFSVLLTLHTHYRAIKLLTLPPTPSFERTLLRKNGTPLHVGTPNLRKLATEPGSAYFHRFYAAAGVCSPTRASIMTGRTHQRDCIEFALSCCELLALVPLPPFACLLPFRIPIVSATLARVVDVCMSQCQHNPAPLPYMHTLPHASHSHIPNPI